MPNYQTFSEVGRTGLKRWGGRIHEEFLPELSGMNAIRVYREMRENDPVVGAIMFAIEMLMRQVSWRVDPVSQNNADLEAAEFLESCLEDMSQTWGDTISEILSFLVYGWSFHETVYKRRLGESRDPTKNSKHKDGRIGWRKLPIRAQETLMEWEFDESGGVQAMRQQPPPDFISRTIPMDKALLFRTRTEKGNPEGRSILRNAYRPWYFKRRIEEIEGIGIERDLAGLPVLTPPQDLNIWDDQDPDMVLLRREAEEMVQGVRRDQMEGVVKPNGWEFSLLSTGGRRQIDVGAVIERYDRRIAMTVLADFILLGHEKVGSFALASSKTDLFGVALGAWLDSIAAVFNRYAIPRLFALNPGLPQEYLPQLKHGDIESPDLKELGAFIKDMTGVGVIIPDPELESYVRQVAHLPERMEDEE
ncbi:phage portal protein family protein [Paenibacillus naphthalenovorans]|uniref:phage portal protein family protein n=1 Tax=Paenibacillus naphthalenovorans TaxID=162209 RepID=UPI003D26DCA8